MLEFCADSLMNLVKRGCPSLQWYLSRVFFFYGSVAESGFQLGFFRALWIPFMLSLSLRVSKFSSKGPLFAAKSGSYPDWSPLGSNENINDSQSGSIWEACDRFRQTSTLYWIPLRLFDAYYYFRKRLLIFSLKSCLYFFCQNEIPAFELYTDAATTKYV